MQTTEISTVPIGVAGIAGYGGTVLRAVHDLVDQAGPPPLRVAAAFEAMPERAPEQIEELRHRGVRVHSDFDALLADDEIRVVWLPVPIHLHEPMTRRALAAGKAVMCEKPAAASVAEVDSMIAARDAAGLPVRIGFQEVYLPTTRALKTLLLSGELGAVRSLSVRACWPRPTSYFARNAWAGRREVEGRPVYDSPLSNALAHFVNLPLFLAGEELEVSARVDDLDARLYRAADIENFDTVTLRATLDTGVDFRVWLTHASATTVQPVIVIECERGRITRDSDVVRIERHDQQPEQWPKTGRDMRPMLRALARAVDEQEDPESLHATLETSRPHVELIETLAGLPIDTIPDASLAVTPLKDSQVLAIPDIAERFELAERRGEAPLTFPA